MKNKKIVSIIFIFLLVFQTFSTFFYNNVYGADAFLFDAGHCGYHLQYWHNDTWYYIDNDMVYYQAANGKQYPAYCIDYGVQGVGDNGQQNQTVNIDNIMGDQRIWRMVTSSYPYKSLSELGVSCIEDAYIATRQAIYCVLLGRSVADTEARYRSAEEGADERGGQIYNLLVKLVKEGLHGTRTMIQGVGQIKKLTDPILNGNYYEVTYQVTGNCNIGNYNVYTSKFPSGTTIEKLSDNKFKIKILKDKLTSNIDGKIEIDIQLESYPVFYGSTYDSNLQNYAIAADPYQNDSMRTTLSIDTGVEITGKKISNDNNIWTGHKKGQGVAGATYEIRRKSDNSLVSTVTTCEDGTFKVTLNPDTYTIQEVKAPNNFKLDPIIHEFIIDNIFDSTTVKLYEDVEKGGYFNLIKYSKDPSLQTGLNANSRLSGATFEIRKKSGNTLVKTVTTNSNGTLDQSIKLELGNYTIQEVKAPRGYKLDSTVRNFSITNNEQKLILEFYDSAVPMGTVNLIKKSSDDNLWKGDRNNNPLANATFLIKSNNVEIVDEKGNVSISTFETEVTTNRRGTLDYNLKLNKGDYTIQEIKAPNGYYLDKKVYEFSIKNNKEEIELLFNNKPIVCGLFNLRKITSNDNLWNGDRNNNPLANATFLIRSNNVEIVDEKGNVSTTTFEKEVTTNSEGTLDEDLKLHKGDYTIQEIKAPNGYYLDKKEYKFSITDNKQEINLDFTNTPVVCGLFNLKKLTNDDNLWNSDRNNNPLANATFLIKSNNVEIVDEKGNVSTTTFEKEVTTNSEGTLDEDLKLHKGDYTIQEIKAPEGYYIDASIYTFSITDNKQEINLDFTNTPAVCGLFNLKKISNDDNLWTKDVIKNALANATFVIKSDNVETIDKFGNVSTTTFEKEVTTNSEGTLDEDLMLHKGDYTIQEIKAPNGYYLDKKVYEFSIKNNKEEIELLLTNTPIVCGLLKFVKITTDDNLWTHHLTGKFLPNATYLIKSEDVETVDEFGNVSTSTFEKEVTTNEEGTLDTYLMLKKGKYTIQEIKAPEGYYLDTNVYEFEVKYNKQEINLDFTNTPVVCGLFNLKKISNDDNLWTKDVIKNPLANATFVIKSDNVETVDEFGNVSTTTFEKEVITNSEGTLDEDLMLHKGDYTIQEIKAPEGYYIDASIYTFSITDNKQEINLDFTNTPALCGLFNLKKISNDDNLWTKDVIKNALANATFVIKSDNVETIDEFGNVSTTTFETEVTTNSEGTLDEDLMLHKGDYTIQEIKAPASYYLDTNIYSFSVTNNKQEINLNFTNTPVVCGLFNLKKISNDDNLWTKDVIKNALANATFVIKSDNVETVDEFGNVSTTTFEKEVTTNSEGTLDEDLMLHKGDYTIQEIKAPEGYYIDASIYTFSITDNKQEVSLDFTNTPVVCGLLNINKISANDNVWNNISKGNPLANATFLIKSNNAEIVDEKGNVSTSTFEKEVTTNSEGTLDEDLMLHKGHYTIQEIKAPEYYLLDPNVYEFEVTNNKQKIEIEIEDDSIDINICIDKVGLIQTQANDEIRYNFINLENNSNIPLDNFTWEDILPYHSIKITKLFTGTYNYDLDYNVYYKTNISENDILIGTYNTMKNNYIDMSKIQLKENEEIISFKINFGTVPEDFRAIESPFIFARVRSFITNGDTWTNYTKLYGFYDSKKYVDKYNIINDKQNVFEEGGKIYRIEDKSEWTTTAYSKKLSIKVHPKTGM